MEQARTMVLVWLGLLTGAWAGLSGCSQPQSAAHAPPTPHTAESYVRPYTAAFGYGSNLGYYGAAWPDERLAKAVRQLGAQTMRVTLPDQFLAQWGRTVRQPAFAYYADSLQLRDLVCFVGEPSEAHRDPTLYPGCREPSKLFANLYEPIWTPEGRVNPRNYYAAYLYELIQNYGSHIRIWEVVNEPDFITDTSNKQWLTRAPHPAETTNTLAPVYHYIRTLRITWEVVKKYAPDDYVTPGGLGYAEYLDALLRYTDNPADGTPSPQFPAKGGAYFDVLDYHVYPAYYLRRRNLLHTGFRYERNSDNAAAQVINHQQQFEDVLMRHGFDGRVYPRKHFIVTETNIGRRTAEWRYGSDAMQRNFGIKALVAAQKHGLRQLHFYSVGETADAPAPPAGVAVADEFKLMGLYENLNRDAPGREKLTELGLAFGTTARLLRHFRYDPARTRALHLPPTADGAAFGQKGRYIYVLWAKTQADMREDATATYSFPAGWHPAGLERLPWHFAASGDKQQLSANNIALEGAPAFFVPAPDRTPPLAGLQSRASAE